MFSLAFRQRLDAHGTYCLPPESARNILKPSHPVNPCEEGKFAFDAGI